MSAATKRTGVFLACVALTMAVAGCGRNAVEPPLGSAERPIRMYYVPSEEAARVLANANAVAAALEASTGYKFKTAVPTNYAAVIEAIGAGQADIAWLTTTSYVIAHNKYGADVALTVTRQGSETYQSQIIARADSGIKTIEGCNGMRVAWVDPASASGYLYASALFAKRGIKPATEFFAGGHPQVVLAVYAKNADCGATYHSPRRPDGTPGDARGAVLKTHPDVERIVAVIATTDPIPNDTVTFRKDLPADMREKIVSALIAYSQTPEGNKTLDSVLNITGFVRSDDSRYNIVRETLRLLNKRPEDLEKKP